MSFNPPFNQALLTNTPWEELEMQPGVEAALLRIGEQITDRDLSATTQGGSPMDNSGAQYENEIFKARCYCWCDGKLHPEGCPPNFEWRDFRASWYKHVCRGASQNREMALSEIEEMERECLSSLPVGNPGAIKRRAEAYRRGGRMCECGHPYWMHLESGGCDGGRWEPEWQEREIADGLVADLAILPQEETEESACPCDGFKLARRNRRLSIS